MQRRVVITGLGVVSPLGIGHQAFWSALLRGTSAVGPITRFDASGFATQIAAEVRDFDPTAYMDRKEARRNDRFVQFAYAASRLALDDARYTITPSNAARTGVLIGSGIGGATTWEDQHRQLMEHGPDRVSPFFVPMIITNMASGVTSILVGAKGPSSCVVTACA
ncbi:MAG: beta-ketoacyl synthase N-terminal-like domain-containing protein, partial [bacterium]